MAPNRIFCLNIKHCYQNNCQAFSAIKSELQFVSICLSSFKILSEIEIFFTGSGDRDVTSLTQKSLFNGLCLSVVFVFLHRENFRGKWRWRLSWESKYRSAVKGQPLYETTTNRNRWFWFKWSFCDHWAAKGAFSVFPVEILSTNPVWRIS